jgi:hypothetical protein
MTAIREVEIKIRDRINDARRKTALLRDRAKWAMLCSSLDVIGDTELATASYLSRGALADEGLRDTGNLYVILYGMLQVLYVQQDALKHLHEALGLTYVRDSELSRIRRIRNDAIGHPTHGNYGQSFHFLARITLSPGGCQMITMRPGEDTTEMMTINLPEIVVQHQTVVEKVLRALLSHLEHEDESHRAMFKDKKLTDCFPPRLGHTHEKIAGAIRGDEPRPIGTSLAPLVSVINNFKAALDERGLLQAYDTVTYTLESWSIPSGTCKVTLIAPASD